MEKRTSLEFNLSETIGMASVNADEWLEKALKRVDSCMEGGAALRAAPIAGFVIAAAISYHADRQVDAAEIIAHAILEASGKARGHG